MQIAIAHAAELAWCEGRNLRHIGLVPPAAAEVLSSLGPDIDRQEQWSSLHRWIELVHLLLCADSGRTCCTVGVVGGL